MRRFRLMFCIVVLLICAACLHKTEPPKVESPKVESPKVAVLDGFRGLKWGQAFETVKDEMVYIATFRDAWDVEFYRRKNDEMIVDGVKVDRILYGFWQKKFLCVHVSFSGHANFTLLKGVLLERFGAEKQANRALEEYLWDIPKEGVVALEYKEANNLGRFAMFSKKVFSEAEEFEKKQKKERAQEGF